jgi:aminotransferase
MPLTLSNRENTITQAEIRIMTIECTKIGGINLAQGICDIGVPAQVAQGAIKAIKSGINSYTRYDGLPELRHAIAEKMNKYNHISADPEKEIVVSAGATGAFYASCLSLLNEGDEVILFEPYYGYHINILQAVGVTPKFVTMHPPNWTFTLDDLEKAITPRTKGVMVCTPSNPCGKVFNEKELRWIATWAKNHDIFIFTDEIYEYFLYDGGKHLSPGSLSEIKDRTITISGYSKTFSITGWRIGYCVADKKWTERIGYMNDLVYVCAPAPLQVGVAAGIKELPDDFYERLRNEFKNKRDLLCSTLDKIGLKPFIPQGAYYILADVSDLPGSTSKAKAMYLLRKTGVASVPGSAFFHGQEGENYVRFCFAKSRSDLEIASKRLLELTRI